MLTHYPQHGNENVTLDVSSDGTIYAKSQLTDYVLRGEALAEYSIFRFMMDTYDSPVRRNEESTGADDAGDGARRPGRPRNTCSRYREPHPCFKTKQRIVRTAGHRNLVNVVGRWFPRNDDPAVRDTYCAAMLTLLKPWRDVSKDLKGEQESWEDAFAAYMATATEEDKYVVSGAQYFHECALAAEAHRGDEDAVDQVTTRGERPYDMLDDEDDDAGEDGASGPVVCTEEGLAALKAMQVSLAEKLHALHAIAAAKRVQFFADRRVETWQVCGARNVSAATGDELLRLSKWRMQLANDVANRQLTSDGSAGEVRGGSAPAVVAGTPNDIPNVAPSVAHVDNGNPPSEDALPAVDVECLRPDQFRAYDIILWHLEQTLAGADVPPLRMVLYGEGGTGKSRVIQTVTEAFAARGCAYMLVKAAYTGIAASLIDGKTTHVIGHVAVKKDGQLTDDAKRQLQAFWRGKRYLVLDEYSMLAKSFFAVLARHIGIGKEGDPIDGELSFGGISVILCGDLHQFPPVACSRAEPLFMRTDMERDLAHPDRVLGRKIYEEFTTVVILKEQMRVTDPTWRDFLCICATATYSPRTWPCCAHSSLLPTTLASPPRTPVRLEKHH